MQTSSFGQQELPKCEHTCRFSMAACCTCMPGACTVCGKAWLQHNSLGRVKGGAEPAGPRQCTLTLIDRQSLNTAGCDACRPGAGTVHGQVWLQGHGLCQVRGDPGQGGQGCSCSALQAAAGRWCGIQDESSLSYGPEWRPRGPRDPCTAAGVA